MPNNKYITQRDLSELITPLAVNVGKLDTKIDFAIKRIDELDKGTVDKINTLFKDKADRAELDKVQLALNEFQKHVNENMEGRVRELEEATISKEKQDSIETSATIAKVTLWLYGIALGGLYALMIYHILNIK